MNSQHIVTPRPSCMTPDFLLQRAIGRLTPFVTTPFRSVRVTKRTHHQHEVLRNTYCLEYLAQKRVVNTPAEAVAVIKAWREVAVEPDVLVLVQLPLFEEAS